MADVKELTVGGTTYKIKDEVCRTNILYVLGKTGYNLLEVTATSGTVSGVAYTVNKNAITISSNGSNTTSTFVLNSGSPLFKASNNIFAIDKVMPAGATITVKYTDGTIVGFNANNQNTNTTLNNAKDVESIYLYIDANKTINDTIKVMVCTQDDWEVTHEITPYQGIQNYDLTRLQSEDRAGLVECVDGGAKNQLNVALDTIKGLNTGGTWTNNRYVNYGVTFTVNSDGTVTATGTAEAQHNASLILAKYSTSTAIEGMVLSGVPNANGARIAIQRNSSPWSTVVYIDSGTSDKIIPSFNYESILFCMVSGGSTVTNAVFKPMICTKAAFGVSQKFVPYQTIPKVIILCPFAPDLYRHEVTGIITLKRGIYRDHLSSKRDILVRIIVFEPVSLDDVAFFLSRRTLIQCRPCSLASLRIGDIGSFKIHQPLIILA